MVTGQLSEHRQTGVPSINPAVPPHLGRRLTFIPDDASTMGTLLVGPPGVGKSRILGRVQAFQYFAREIPCIIFDPTGGACDNFLDKMTRLPENIQRQLWPRVRYVNCAGTPELVTPLPLFYRLGTESLYQISQRLPDVWVRLDPHLQTASILGWNSLHPLATACGMLLSAMGCQITEVADLLHHPDAWQTRLAAAVASHPEAQTAERYLTDEFFPLSPRDRQERSQAYLTKVRQLTWDSVSQAMYGAGTIGIDWSEVVAKRLIVFCDFRDIQDRETMRFRLLWLMRSVVDYIRQRGAGYDRTPLAWLIDELTAVLSPAMFSEDLVTADLEELISRLARSHKVWLTVALQDIGQVPERMQRVLLRMGTKIFGSVQDADTALMLARRFYRFDPYRVKAFEPVFSTSFGVSDVIHERPIYFTREEQQELSSVHFVDLPRYHFLVSAATGEGTMSSSLRRISIERLDQGQYVNATLVPEVRARLSRRDGQRVQAVLEEIHRRQGTDYSATRVAPSAPMATRVRIKNRPE